jgi:hypothetical protein
MMAANARRAKRDAVKASLPLNELAVDATLD